jgi:hypothetical protein
MDQQGREGGQKIRSKVGNTDAHGENSRKQKQNTNTRVKAHNSAQTKRKSKQP